MSLLHRLAFGLLLALIGCRSESPSIERALLDAKIAHRPLVIVLGAEWCGACRLLERTTFADRSVVERLTRFAMIKLDLSRDDDAAKALARRFRAENIPTIAFVDSTGKDLASPHLTGYVGADELAWALDRVR